MFVNCSTLTKELYCEALKKRFGKITVLRRIEYIALAVMLLAIAALQYLNGKLILAGILLILAGAEIVVMLLLPEMSTAAAYKQQSVMLSEKQITTEFLEDRFLVYSEFYDSRHPYSHISGWYETKNTFCMLMGASVVIFDKNGFRKAGEEEPSAEAYEAFLTFIGDHVKKA